MGLATGVAEPALHAASITVGRELSAEAAKVGRRAGAGVSADNPLTVMTTAYRPVPPNSALGLSAFYISLLAIMCGFLGAILVNSTVDAALGYGTTEIGPKWRQSMPIAISRWQTLLAKWCIGLAVVPILTGILLLVSVGILHMYAPYVWYLWLFTSFAGIAIAAGTLVLFAALGSLGQLVAMLLFVYLARHPRAEPSRSRRCPRSSGSSPTSNRCAKSSTGCAPSCTSTRRGCRPDAGPRAHPSGLVLWVVVGATVTTWYDRRGLDRMAPGALEFVQRSTRAYEAKVARADVPDPEGET